MKGSHFVPSLLLFSLLLSVFQAQNCRSHETCSICLQDPQCGWCETYDVCVNGSSSGPSTGSCAVWDYYVCPSPSPSPASLAPTLTLGEDWPMFGGSVAHTGYRSLDMDVTGAQIGWRSSYGTASSSTSTASVLCDGMLLSTTIINRKIYLSALDGRTGDKLFNIELTDTSLFSTSPPSCRGGIAYIQIGDKGGGNAYVYAVDYTTQTVLWTGHGVMSGGVNNYGVVPHPENGLVYFPGGARDGVLFGLNADGTSNFSQALYNATTGCSSWTPTVLENNELCWTTNRGKGMDSGFFGVNDPTTGVSEWTVPVVAHIDDGVTEDVVVVANDIAMVNLFENFFRTVSGINLTTQEVIWQFSKCTSALPGPRGMFTDFTLSTDGKVVAMACNSSVFLLDVETGELLSTLSCDFCAGQPIITPKFLILSANDNSVFIVPRSGADKIPLIAKGALLLSGNILFVTDLSTGDVAAWELTSNP